jgi:hypothetical protein
MAETVGQHSVAAFTSPVNGTTPIDANTVRGNDNTVRSAYVDHDADPGIHVQSSTLASRPVAGTAGRKWVTVSSGRYQFWYDDGSRWHEVASDAVNVDCLADEALTKGDVIKITGFNNGQNLPTVAKTTSATDTAFGIVENTVASGAIVQIVNTGIIEDVNTNGYAIGTILYPNASGGFTTTKPTSGNYQPAAYVLRGNTNTGVLYAEFSAPRIVERSDNTASTIVLRDASGNFAAGTITAGALTSTGLVTFASLKGTGATTVTNILDEDNMASDSATALATQQSIKAYVDAQVATVDTLAEVLANGNTTGANNIIVTAGQKITTNTIDETTSGSGVTIDSVLLKDDVVNATDIETGTVSANDGTLAVTIANSTGALTLATALADSNLATISTAGKVANSATTATALNTSSAIVARDSSGNFAAGTITANLTGNISGTAPAGTLTGTTLASNVVSSSLTSVGTLTSLTVSGGATFASTSGNVGIGTTSPTDTGGFGKVLDIQSATGGQMLIRDSDDTTRYGRFAYDGTDNSTWVEATGTGSLIRFRTAGTQKMSLDASGNLAVDTNTLYVDATNNRVGIGTASPSSRLEVVGGSASNVEAGVWEASSSFTALSLNGDMDTGANFYSAPTQPLIINRKTGYGISFRQNNTQEMLLDASGNLGLSSGNLSIASGAVLYLSGAGGNAYLQESSGTVFIGAGGSGRMQVTSTGNLGLGVTPSAWDTSVFRTMQIGTGAGSASLSGRADGSKDLILASNVYYATGNFRYVGTGTATMYRMDGATHSWGTAVSGTAGNVASLTQAMTLDASGNLGVGETSPSSYGKLAVTSAGIGGHFNSTSGAAGINFYESGSGRFSLRTLNGSAGLSFYDSFNSAERARITSGGYFKASVAGTYAATDSYHEMRTSNGNWTLYAENTAASSMLGVNVVYSGGTPNGTGNPFLQCTDGTVRAAIRSNGGLANYQANNVDLSDVRTKTDITPLDSMWGKVAALEIVSYKYVDQTHDDVNLGVIAQQVETVEPVWVDSDGFGDTPEGEEPMKTVYNKDIYFAAIKALQEAMARIESLEARLAALEN